MEVDPYTAPLPFPQSAPGPAEHETLAGMAPDLLPRSQDVDLVVSAIDIPIPPALRSHLKSWTREDLNVRVFQGVRRGGPPSHRVWCRETGNSTIPINLLRFACPHQRFQNAHQ